MLDAMNKNVFPRVDRKKYMTNIYETLGNILVDDRAENIKKKDRKYYSRRLQFSSWLEKCFNWNLWGLNKMNKRRGLGIY